MVGKRERAKALRTLGPSDSDQRLTPYGGRLEAGHDLTATRALVCIGGGKKERGTKSLPGLARTINGHDLGRQKVAGSKNLTYAPRNGARF